MSPIVGLLFPEQLLKSLPKDLKYLPCKGQLVLKRDYPELFEVLGHSWSWSKVEMVGEYFKLPSTQSLMVVAATYRVPEQLKLF